MNDIVDLPQIIRPLKVFGEIKVDFNAHQFVNLVIDEVGIDDCFIDLFTDLFDEDSSDEHMINKIVNMYISLMNEDSYFLCKYLNNLKTNHGIKCILDASWMTKDVENDIRNELYNKDYTEIINKIRQINENNK